MLLIQGLTSDPLQKMRIVIPDGSSFSMTIYFVPMQLTWVITELVYNDFTLQGLRMTTSPNMLFQFMNQIPFGLACYTVNNRDPQLQQDFELGSSLLYLLTQAECEEYQGLLSE